MSPTRIPGAAGSTPAIDASKHAGLGDASDARIRAAIQDMPIMMDAFDDRLLIAVWNAECERVTGYSAAEVVGNPKALEMLYPDPAYRNAMIEEWAARGNEYRNWAWEITCKDGTKRTIEWSNVSGQFPIAGWATWGIGVDVTDKRKLEAQLLHAQKMDAIGHLAGGIAHDFNNLLTVINSASREIQAAVDGKDSALRSLAEMIADAGDRGALLTRQLLLFSSKAPLHVEAMVLDDVVAQTDRLLRRLIGETVEFSQELSAAGRCVRADLGQLEQVIINLCINARDAMPKGGRLLVRTSAAAFSNADVARRPELKVGKFVQLTVRDTGVGMSSDVRAHLFEPFFTTKGLGKGTGLGLATVYGIVKSVDGFIVVESEVGAGTTISVYLPEVAAAAVPAAPAPPATKRTGGSETVLLVEDEAPVRVIVQRQLVNAGYRVLEAPNGEAALLLSQAHAGPIDLLITDVVLPGKSGPDTATALRDRHPGLRVLFMSGYTDVPEGAELLGALLQKPFSANDLLATVRGVLDTDSPTARH
jgi:two-component system cell cycle sensor histidine kinase/response regulator CckA